MSRNFEAFRAGALKAISANGDMHNADFLCRERCSLTKAIASFAPHHSPGHAISLHVLLNVPFTAMEDFEMQDFGCSKLGPQN